MEIGLNNDEFIKASEMVTKVFKNIENSQLQNSNNIINSWQKTIQSIKPDGYKLANHSKVIDLKNGIVLVETDHSGWIQILKIHEKYIIKGLKNLNKSLTINSLAFCLKDSQNKILSSQNFEKIQKEKFIKKIEDDEKKIESFNNNGQNKKTEKELPLELKNKFERLRQEMLTNN